MSLDLEAIKARLEDAPGPLSHDRSGRLYGPDRRPGCIVTRTGWGYGATRGYRTLLTHSAEDIRGLVEEVERLRKTIIAMRDGGHELPASLMRETWEWDERTSSKVSE